MEKEKIEKIVSKHRHDKAALLAILHEVQEQEKQLGVDSLRNIAELMDVSFAHVYGLATFYGAFSTSRKGDTEIRVCDGIACHINGARQVIDAIQSHLSIEIGETSWDEKYSLEKVQCLGLCAIGPNVALDGKAHSHLDKEKVSKILQAKEGK